MKNFLFAAAAAAVLASGASAQAAIVNAPVPVNAYIHYNGYDWAWASPLDAGSVDLSYQSAYGWRLPTAAELALAPTALMFKFKGANVPLGGSDPVSGAVWAYTSSTLDNDAALASPYFSGYYHGDWCNGVGSNCGFGELPWNNGASYADSLVIRGSGGGAVPEPATWALMIGGFGLAGATLRRRRLAVA